MSSLSVVGANLMALPPWARELFVGSLDDVSRRLQNTETIRDLQNRASQLLGGVPTAAARAIDRMVQEARKGSDQVRRWVNRQTTLNIAAINGTGIYFHPLVQGTPLESEAAEILAPSDHFFALSGGLAENRIDARLNSAVQKVAGFNCLLANSTSAAMIAIGSSVRKGASIFVPRTCATSYAGNSPFPDLLAVGGQVVEFGTSSGVQPLDLRSRFQQAGTGSVLFEIVWPDACCTDSGSPGDEDEWQDLPVARFIPYGTFKKLKNISGDQYTFLEPPVIAKSWLTILPTERLLFGPAAALIIGSDDALSTIRQTSVWKTMQAPLPVRAAVATVLELSPSTNAVCTHSPDILAGVSVENLQNRAERIATQLAAEDQIVSCHITQLNARLGTEMPATIPSRQLRIKYKTPSERWAERLQGDTPALLTEIQDGELVLDLRWIPSNLDGQLAGLITNRGFSQESSEDSDPSQSNDVSLNGAD